jgi:DNA mismatch endonuclease (patch repair protein)
LIKSANTKPEIAVRSMLHANGYRFRLHAADLPGTPDIVFRGTRKVIFVNGCFWHSHECQWRRVFPKTNATFWNDKRMKTVERDKLNERRLSQLGWGVLTVWECELRSAELLRDRLVSYLS